MNHSITILIPIKNEAKNIKNCLQRIWEQTYFKQITEILIVDANSSDNSLAIIETLQTQCDNKIIVLQDPREQRSSGLNHGIKQATGDFIIRIDARAIIPKDYVERCIQVLLEAGADNAGGIQKPVSDVSLNAMQQAIGLAMSHPFGVGKARFRLGQYSGPVDSVYLGCFRRELFNKIGLFDEESPIISEDSDINYRIRQAKGIVYLDSDIVVQYVPREKLLDIARLYFRYGGARAGFVLKWKTYTALRQLIPQSFVLMLLGLPFFNWISPVFGYGWLGMILGYGVSNIYVSSRLAISKRCKRLFPFLFCVFPTMHFAWAFGFWKRLLQGKYCKLYWQN